MDAVSQLAHHGDARAIGPVFVALSDLEIEEGRSHEVIRRHALADLLLTRSTL